MAITLPFQEYYNPYEPVKITLEIPQTTGLTAHLRQITLGGISNTPCNEKLPSMLKELDHTVAKFPTFPCFDIQINLTSKDKNSSERQRELEMQQISLYLDTDKFPNLYQVAREVSFNNTLMEWKSNSMEPINLGKQTKHNP